MCLPQVEKRIIVSGRAPTEGVVLVLQGSSLGVTVRRENRHFHEYKSSQQNDTKSYNVFKSFEVGDLPTNSIDLSV